LLNGKNEINSKEKSINSWKIGTGNNRKTKLIINLTRIGSSIR
jgi:hypothetical protein